MAEMTIRLRTDPVTGKKDIIVDLKSDEDALPHEHEQQHRALVQKLLEGGVVKAEELGKVVVRRDQPAAGPAESAPAATPDERQAESQGQ